MQQPHHGFKNIEIKKCLFIFRNTKITDLYFILFMDEKEANWMFEIATRTGPKYSVPPADGIPYAFPQLPLEKVLKLDTNEDFVHFIQRDIAEYVKDDKKNFGDWGWYILKEINIEKWKALYETKLSERRKELQQVVEKEKKAEQIKMF